MHRRELLQYGAKAGVALPLGAIPLLTACERFSEQPIVLSSTTIENPLPAPQTHQIAEFAPAKDDSYTIRFNKITMTIPRNNDIVMQTPEPRAHITISNGVLFTDTNYFGVTIAFESGNFPQSPHLFLKPEKIPEDDPEYNPTNTEKIPLGNGEFAAIIRLAKFPESLRTRGSIEGYRIMEQGTTGHLLAAASPVNKTIRVVNGAVTTDIGVNSRSSLPDYTVDIPYLSITKKNRNITFTVGNQEFAFQLPDEVAVPITGNCVIEIGSTRGGKLSLSSGEITR